MSNIDGFLIELEDLLVKFNAKITSIHSVEYDTIPLIDIDGKTIYPVKNTFDSDNMADLIGPIVDEETL